MPTWGGSNDHFRRRRSSRKPGSGRCAIRAGAAGRRHRGTARTPAADLLPALDLRNHRDRVVLRQHGPGRAHLRARFDPPDLRPVDGGSRAAVQHELPRHVRGRRLRRPACRPFRPRPRLPGQHDLLGIGQPVLRSVHHGDRARRIPPAARLRNGHGVPGRAVDGLGDHAGAQPRPLHRVPRRILAARLHRVGPADLLRAAGRRLALGLHLAGDPGRLRACRAPFRSGIAALARLARLFGAGRSDRAQNRKQGPRPSRRQGPAAGGAPGRPPPRPK